MTSRIVLKTFLLFISLSFLADLSFAQKEAPKDTIIKADTLIQSSTSIISTPDTGKLAKKFMTGADQVKAYATFLKGKKVAVVANQTSMVGNTRLIDTLLKMKIAVVCIFSPEHGLTGNAGAGEKVENGVDEKSNLPIISLYGDHLKPSKKDMADINIVLYDIQDVGVRYYTYISTLHYVMEACAENGKQLIVLDRPNPNGFYIDGPVLSKGSKSFVGMDPIPVVYGLTVGELATMMNMEGWIKGGPCQLRVIKMKNYSHDMKYNLPVWPSPNLTDMKAIYAYPSLGFFEGTRVSVGRGTDHPFQVMGYPGMEGGDTKFTPVSTEAAPTPMYQDTLCNGWDLSKYASDSTNLPKQLNLSWLTSMYENYPDQKKFFTPFFDKLAGTSKLKEQLQKKQSEETIRASWKQDLDEYIGARKKYLMYPEISKEEKKAQSKAAKVKKPKTERPQKTALPPKEKKTK